MVHVQNIRIAPTGLSDRFNGLLQALRDHIARRRVFRKTLSELNALSTRELADLGINPGMVRSIAFEAAYGT